MKVVVHINKITNLLSMFERHFKVQQTHDQIAESKKFESLIVKVRKYFFSLS